MMIPVVAHKEKKVLFEQSGVHQLLADDPSYYKSAHLDESSAVSGKLEIVERMRSIFIEWHLLQCEPLILDSNDWVLADHCHIESSSTSEKDEPVADESKRKQMEFCIELQDLRSYKCFHDTQPDKVTLKFYCKDGSTYNPVIFRSGGYNDFVSCLQGFVSLNRSAKEQNLILVSDLKAEQLQKSVNVLLQENSADFFQKLISNPYATTLTSFGKVMTLVNEKLITPLLDFNDLGYDEQQQTLRTLEELKIQDRDVENQLFTHQDSSGFNLVTKVLLPNRPEVPRGPELSDIQWRSFINADGKVTQGRELRAMIFRGGIEKHLRQDVWKFLLGYFIFGTTEAERREFRKKKVDEYFRMKLQWKSISEEQESRFIAFRDRKALIEKDVSRTDRSHPFFQGANNANLTMLSDILMTYCMYNFDLGYVQGMSDLLAPIMVVMENEVDSFWCFVYFMNRTHRNFEMDQQHIKTQLNQLRDLEMVINPGLFNYLESHDSDNMFFCFRWLLVLFKREFTFDNIMSLWEVLWTDLPCKNFHLLICLTILDSQKDMIMENRFGFTEILKHINELSMKIPLEETLCQAEGIYHQLAAVQDKLPAHICEILGFSYMEDARTQHHSIKSEGYLRNDGSGSSIEII